MTALVPIVVAVPPTLSALFQVPPHPTAWKVLVGLGLATLAVAAPTSFRDIWSVARRLIPGGSSNGRRDP